MSKIKTKAVFKEYNQQQIQLLPPSFDELIPENDLVRVVNQVVDSLDLGSIINQYDGGGTSAYHPRMLTKVILYGYATKIYTGRKLAKAIRQDIHFIWLAAFNRPDFRTINLFRSGILKETIEELFKQLLLFLVDHGHVRVENYFTDGTFISADANKHQVVWRKNAERYKKMAEDKLPELMTQIEELNKAEDSKYGDHDLEEVGEKPISKEDIAKGTEKLNEVIEKTTRYREKRKAESLKKKVQEQTQKIEKYESQLEIAQQRSGFSKTDTDASVMMMKNEEFLPAYNVLASSEDQFITAVTVHQNPNDATGFKEHVNSFTFTPATITADSVFGTEENYQFLESKEVRAYLKYPLFHKEQSRRFREDPYRKENFRYQAETDTFECPEKKPLHYTHSRRDVSKTGFSSDVKIYKASACVSCPRREACTKSVEGNRTITVNNQLDIYKKIARTNLESPKGIELRKQRSVEIESCFGDIKHNMRFRRFHLRGLKKVKTEITIVSIAHNLRKLQIKQMKSAA
ncbi:MAG: transposase [Marivirga sp.]|nr:transposase [Marivirga sp.]